MFLVKQGPAEVGGVEAGRPHRLVHGAQFAEGELGSDERGGQVAGLEVGSGPLHRVSDDAPVVEGQLEAAVDHLGDRPQRGVVGIGPGSQPTHVGQHREVGDGDHVHAGVAVGVAVGAELGEPHHALDAGLLTELSGGGLIQGFVGSLEAAGQRPRPPVGLAAASDQQHLQLGLIHGEDDHVDGDGEAGEGVGVVVVGRSTGRCPSRHGRTLAGFWSH